MHKTHNNNALRTANINQIVSLRGWVSKVRNLGGLLFIDLRDKEGITQLVIKPASHIYEQALTIRNEFVIWIKGQVVLREKPNHNIATGEIEIIVTDLDILSTAKTPPMIIANETDALEDTRLKYRYLDLRRPVMQQFLIKRHEISQAIRNALINEGFLELETPLLGRSTPEGARDYLVPSRLYEGQFYALPQSPQQYKQLFMVAGFEKYFQIAKCFRDEDLRADRQPEFSQVDIECSFIDELEIQTLIEKVLKEVFLKVANKTIQTPFLRMSYDDAMNVYGSDKPDLRYDLKLVDLTAVFNKLSIPLFQDASFIKGIIVDESQSITRKVIDQYQLLVKKHHGKALAYIRMSQGELSGSIHKFLDDQAVRTLGLKDNQTLFLVPGELADVNQSLGALRQKIAQDLNVIDPNLNAFLWVVDFPLLEFNAEENRYYAMHHPFTAPKDVEILRNHPKEALAKAYDVVLNGYELGGGSIRIHNTETQSLMFKTLGFSESDIKTKFGYFVDALQYGTPPHGGIALGLDRLVMLITKTNNIKDVIAFPKTQSAKDLMMDAPNVVDANQLDELHLKIKS